MGWEARVSEFFFYQSKFKFFFRWGGGRGVGIRVSDFFSINPNLNFFFGGAGGGGGGGARVSDFFFKESKSEKRKKKLVGGGGGIGGLLEEVNVYFTKNPNLKKILFLGVGGGGGEENGRLE